MSAQSLTAYLPAIIAAAAAVGVGLVGGLLTEIGPWYRALRKPRWQPPDWAFAPAWTLIFTLCAISGAKAWWALAPGGGRALLLTAFAINGALNLIWSALFFRAHRPDWALIELFALWASIVAMMAAAGHASTTAAMLLLPYLAWVTFAGVLNGAIVKLNAPFGGTRA